MIDQRKTKPFATSPGKGRAFWSLGGLFDIKAAGSDMRDQFSLCEVVMTKMAEPPLHVHHREDEAWYVLEGKLRIFVRDPKEEVRLGPGESYAVRPGRPHLVTNGGETSATFLVLQGIGEYDYVPLT
jgi:mannose-6-phosphate isomerase-like protein (cupin superfamily)